MFYNSIIVPMLAIVINLDDKSPINKSITLR